jgi:hypothetical protein
MANIRSTSQHSPRREDNLLPNETDLFLLVSGPALSSDQPPIIDIARAVAGDYEQAWGM